MLEIHTPKDRHKYKYVHIYIYIRILLHGYMILLNKYKYVHICMYTGTWIYDSFESARLYPLSFDHGSYELVNKNRAIVRLDTGFYLGSLEYGT